MSKTTCPSLGAVWCRAEREDEVCYTCGGLIGATTLFRTFQVERSNPRPVSMPGSRRRWALGRTIAVFDRHFECAQTHHVAYVTVSHVWHKLISTLHSCGTEQLHDNPETATEASNLIFREIIAVYDGFCESYGRPLEMWLDYLSIPQWAHETKVNILMNIGNIYASSLLTVVLWHDVDQTAVQVIRRSSGAPTDRLIAAITHICSGAWQRRMWTAMEYLRSAQVRVMLRGYILCDDGDDLFMERIEDLWQQASNRLGSMLDLEAAAGLHRNHLVPWQIRGLTSTRKSSANHFALAFQHLALKGCAVPLDFYYALGGLVGFQERLVPPLAGARWQIMKFCLEKQDYSPILMPPYRHTASNASSSASMISDLGVSALPYRKPGSGCPSEAPGLCSMHNPWAS
ncbi:hypothetical protein CLCR_05972 [Cladophialophora carrionii]|uniref:Heterokaryon incompatibility domain-containing protein n=1 Tax=Cladophialophora carrionii TaxID=86049 RepID=A0A1C1C995_9EURO|nr:hypothetical protein CLCR_05972 [Cladophialophora carrionii]